MADQNYSERVVLGLLLEHHPRLIEFTELEATVGDTGDVDYAVRRLMDDGLANRLGGRIGASRAAVRFDELQPI